MLEDFLKVCRKIYDRVDNRLPLSYYYNNNYERITLMSVFVTGTTYVTTKTMRRMTAYGPVGVYRISDYRK